MGLPYSPAFCTAPPRETSKSCELDQLNIFYPIINSMGFHYVYRIRSLRNPSLIYTGFTEDLQRRLADHNASQVTTTAGAGPWHLCSAHAFTDKYKALDFERYLKTGSGREFARRHF